MDVDGDATVDYQEFTIGMTGTANGALDGFSPTDLTKLLAKFVEFAMITKRQRNIDSINSTDYHASDLVRYDYFNRIFELHAQASAEGGADGGSVMTGGSTVSRPGTSMTEADEPAINVNTKKTRALAADLMDELADKESDDLRQRLAEEKALLQESQNLRFEVLKLPKIKRSVPQIKTVMPSMVGMSTSKELKLKYRASREAYNSLHGGTDWSLPKYRMAAPKHLARNLRGLRGSKSDGGLLRRTVS